jgi:hypothetical protein
MHVFTNVNCIDPPAESTICPAERHARCSWRYGVG